MPPRERRRRPVRTRSCSTRCGGSPPRSPRPTPTRSTARPAFPVEAVDALREAARPLGPRARVELGGGGVSFEAVADGLLRARPRAAAPAAMVFAMHQIQVACIVRHLDGSPWFEGYLREVADEQRLIASITSEVGTGGDMGKSVAARLRPGATASSASRSRRRPSPTAATPTPSSTTLRRAPDAEPGDQVLVADAAPSRSTLEPQGTWDPLGMRGTCSPGFVVRGEFAGRAGPGRRRSRTISGRVDDADLPHPLVARLARHRDRRLRPRPRLRPRRGQAQARRAAAGGDPPLAADERAVAAARRGLPGAARVLRRRRRGPRPALGDGDDPALQQPQDRRLRAGAARSARARWASAASSATRTTRRSASAATCATRCRPA